jgi:hypothetical protein
VCVFVRRRARRLCCREGSSSGGAACCTYSLRWLSSSALTFVTAHKIHIVNFSHLFPVQVTRDDPAGGAPAKRAAGRRAVSSRRRPSCHATPPGGRPQPPVCVAMHATRNARVWQAKIMATRCEAAAASSSSSGAATLWRRRHVLSALSTIASLALQLTVEKIKPAICSRRMVVVVVAAPPPTTATATHSPRAESAALQVVTESASQALCSAGKPAAATAMTARQTPLAS